MAETFPAPLAIATGTADLLAGTVHQRTQIEFLPDPVDDNSSPTLKQQFNRIGYKMRQLMTLLAAGMCRKTGTLEVGASPLRYVKSDGTRVNFEGGTIALTASATNYIYILHSTNVLTKSTVGWPADESTFTPLAEYVCGSGDITTSDEDADRRAYSLYRARVSASSPTGTTGTSFTIDDDNAGAGADGQLRVNRGATDTEDAALEWDETNDRWNARAQHTTLTLAPLNASAFKVGGTDVIAADGDLEAASIATDQLYTFGANSDPANGLKLTPMGSAGAPSAGAHTAGEFAVDSAGKVYVCTANGTPGTWQQVGKQDDTRVISIGNGSASAASPASFSIQVQDNFGNAIAETRVIDIYLMADTDGGTDAPNVTAFSASVGSVVRTITANKVYRIKTNASGAATIAVTNSIAGTVYLLPAAPPGEYPMDCRDRGVGTWS